MAYCAPYCEPRKCAFRVLLSDSYMLFLTLEVTNYGSYQFEPELLSPVRLQVLFPSFVVLVTAQHC